MTIDTKALREDMGDFDDAGRVFVPVDRTDLAALLDAADIGLRWNADSSLETWFPLTADRLAALEADNQRLREALGVIANLETDYPHDVAMEALAAGGDQ